MSLNLRTIPTRIIKHLLRLTFKMCQLLQTQNKTPSQEPPIVCCRACLFKILAVAGHDWRSPALYATRGHIRP